MQLGRTSGHPRRGRLLEALAHGRGDHLRAKGCGPLASGNHEAIVIDIVTNNYRVKKVFKELGLRDDQLTPVRTPLVGFTGPPISSEGMITLMVTVGQAPKCGPFPLTSWWSSSRPRTMCSWGDLLERPPGYSSTFTSASSSPPRGDSRGARRPEVARACYLATLRGQEKERPDQVIRIGALLPDEKEGLKALLREYSQVFAWTVDDMPGIPTDLAVHHLDVDPHFKPVKQKKRSFAPERNEVIRAEVGKLLESKIILEVYYPTWLANPVLVKKEDLTWRMCVDFTDLNKACPKDCFPLPRIDRLVDYCGL
nr:uncharacterized protein LOC113708335 [Coffea arabica]